MAMSDLQRYPWNPNLIKIVEGNVVFLNRKLFISWSFSIDYYKQDQVSFAEKPLSKISVFFDTEIRYSSPFATA